MPTLLIHRDMEQEERVQNLDLFKQGVLNVLISTDVGARGLDIKDIIYVVNYDIPEQVETYVHRIGRTGRIRKKGYAVSFCSPHERDSLKEIEEFIGEKIQRLDITVDDYGETVLFSEDQGEDWKKLMELSHELEEKSKKKKNKKKR